MTHRLSILIGFVATLLVLGVSVWIHRDEESQVSLPMEQEYTTIVKAAQNQESPAKPDSASPSKKTLNQEIPAKPDSARPSQKTAATVSTLPEEINLAVPFTSQAPHMNWDMPYKEYCEEASVLMAASYVRKTSIAGPDDAKKRLLAIGAFASDTLGFPMDTTAAETAEILKRYYKLQKVELLENPTVEQMKTMLAAGRVIIVPAAGRLLGNPNFRSPGPLYHMLVVKGYTRDGRFITNDPGTRNGANYLYKVDVLMNAMHDWNPGNMEQGRKVIIIVG